MVDIHGNYRAQRLTHVPPDELISDVVTARTLRPHLVRSGFFFAVFCVVGVISFFLWMISLFATVVSMTSGGFPGGGGGDSGGGLIGLSYFLMVIQLLIVVAWVVSLFLPLREPIAEYGLLIEGRGAAYAIAYWSIMNTTQARHSPFLSRLGRIEGLPVLYLVNGREQGLVVVKPVGTDLYVGWTMWRQRSTVVMIGHLFRDAFQGGPQSDVRAASSRALRELIHSVTREGVQGAILQPPVSDEVARAQIDQLPNLNLSTGPMVANAPQFQPQPPGAPQSAPPYVRSAAPYSGPPAQ
ncbi:hypothetical protein ACFO1B_55965 [Dactylosporangium siamense]|uniref:Uncharacterized protein n=1 Tax=Dactylosporangium siamense TaxID=685454 RepID=A0A919UJW3_9ACTN|nr:hypothetical protein [Dactylosporangium siamense]GIG53113.1 hypothetical protein Dsi01nite_111540 [Dactylosporangium siamense]